MADDRLPFINKDAVTSQSCTSVAEVVNISPTCQASDNPKDAR